MYSKEGNGSNASKSKVKNNGSLMLPEQQLPLPRQLISLGILSTKQIIIVRDWHPYSFVNTCTFQSGLVLALIMRCVI